MKLLSLIAIFCSAATFAQNKYSYTADLNNVVNDRVSVELQSPELKTSQVIFSFAKAIPGSYSQKDFGRFIDDFTAFDKAGNKLKVEKLNVNQYQINSARTLSRITYKVNDTWDEMRKNFIFQPGGSNIEAGKNFVLNHHAFFGYFEGYTNIPFEIAISKPASFYAATHLTVEHKSADLDVLSARNYFSLADNPVIYSVPDTTSFMVGETRINVAVYSANHKIKSSKIAEYLKPMSVALQKFFNGLPIRSYQFLYYFEDPGKALVSKDAGGYGALEHNYSSMYFLPEIALESKLKSLVNEVSGHEFLHILTPLNLHSAEIENFDFTNPKMSRHLWLYEGVTEYFAHLVQFQNGLISEKEFFKNMRDKINEAEEYGTFSMTEMSLNVMGDAYQKKYNSVYSRGALIAFMLDICIREKTEGRKDLKTVITQLSKKYGANKPFEDARLFDEIVEMTHPDVKLFINSYISGEEPLPYAQYFNKIGYEYLPEKRQAAYYAGGMGLKYNEALEKFVFANVKSNVLNIQENDLFEKVNNIPVTAKNLKEIWEEYFNMNTNYPELSVTIKRNNEELVLTGRLDLGYFKVKNSLMPSALKAVEQAGIRNKLNWGQSSEQL